MPRDRVYYTEREVGNNALDPTHETVPGLFTPMTRIYTGRKHVYEAEWEDQVEAANVEAALEEFFGQHAGLIENVNWLDDEDNAHGITGLRCHPAASYIWMENGRIVEYQGIDLIAAGRTVCPFCNGKGTIDEGSGGVPSELGRAARVHAGGY